MYRFRYHITINDILCFNEHFMLKTKSGKKQLLPWRLLFPIVSVLITAYILLSDGFNLSVCISVILYAVISVIWWLCCHKILILILKINLKKKGSLENSLFSPDGEIFFDFDNKMIIDIGEKEEVRVKFNDIIACYDGETAFYLYFNKAKGFILPYSSFSCPEECFSFQTVLHNTFPSGRMTDH